MSKYRLIVIEGGDGVGKTNAVEAVIETIRHLSGTRLTVFDATKFEQAHKRAPTIDDLFHEKVFPSILLIAEPTYAGIGANIRSKLRDGSSIDQHELAYLYALNRDELYTHLVIPYLHNRGLWVVQSRGLLSSLTYQAPAIAQESGRALAEVRDALLRLPGNSLELLYAPNDLFILQAPVGIAQKRLQKRLQNRNDLDAFDQNTALQEQVRDAMMNPVLLSPFFERHTRVHMIDVSNTSVFVRECIANTLKASINRDR